MTVAFIHGNPEVDAIWGPLVDALADHDITDVTLLSPPGFGTPSPADWVASMETYALWLIDELGRLKASGPVDVVGHDWGAGHVIGAVARRPDLIRSWAVDVLGLIHPDYEWHDAAQAWQTPDVGEEAIEAMVNAPVDDKATLFNSLGLPAAMAAEVAAGVNADMGRCVLDLYRDAAQPAMSELGERFTAISRPPGLAINATADAYVPPTLTADAAARLDIPTLDLVDNGHWWMAEDPQTAADGLATFWKTLK